MNSNQLEDALEECWVNRGSTKRSLRFSTMQVVDSPWPPGSSKMAARVRQHLWADNPLGPTEGWQPELRAAVTLVLDSAFPAALIWGDDFVTIYNDGFLPILGNKPDALGRSFAEIWAEAWDEIGPIAGKAYAGEATYIENFPLIVDRYGRPEQAYFTFSCSPVRCADGRVGGMIDIVTETTAAVTASAVQRENEERQAFLLKLTDALRPLCDPGDVQAAAAGLLGKHLDIDRSHYYEVDAEGGATRLNGCAVGAITMPERFPVSDFGPQWLGLYRAGKTIVVENAAVDERFSKGERDAWQGDHLTAGLGVPLLKGGELRAVLALSHSEPRAWRDSEIALVEEVAERTWHAVERVRAEAALRESEEKYRTLFDSIDEGFCIAERIPGVPIDFRYLVANPAFESLTGFSDPVGHSMRELVPEVEEETMARYARVAEGGHTETFFASGFDKEFEVEAIPSDQPGRIAVVVKDVTASRRAETALREREARHRMLIGSWAQAVWETDADGLVVADSPSWRAYTGQTLDEWLGHGWLDAVHPDDRAYAERQWREAIAARELVNAEFRLRFPDGGWRWANVRAAPVRAQDGRVEKWVGMNIDIHESKVALEAREQSERFSRALIEGIPQLVWRAVGEGHWTWSSSQWAEYTGQSEAQSRGLGWLEPVHPDDRARVRQAWAEALEREELSAEYRLLNARSGTYRWFQTRALPVRSRADEIIEWLGTSTDIHQLRTLQGRQQLLLGELQHRVRNILAVVRSVFNRTVDAGGAIEDITEHFVGRLDSLARTQVVVTQNASGRVDLENLVRDELLSVGASDPQKVSLSGPEVVLNAKTAESIGLAVHELTTNALKYGALKVDGATLAIDWNIDQKGGANGRNLSFQWTESGVPVVPLAPSRKGFGRELIEEALPYQLSAETNLKFGAGGVRCTIILPLDDNSEEDGASRT